MFTEQFTNYDFPTLGMIRLPEVQIPVQQKLDIGLKENSSNYDFLLALARKGYKEKEHLLNKEKLQEYKDRAKYELDLFEELGFTDYVLLVWQVINKAREFGAYIDPGRGSCGASFIFALLGITGVIDVIDKGLLFERFISRVRSKKQIIDGQTWLKGDLIADADLNVSTAREKIVEWLHETYKGKICKISAISTMTGKILIKDVYKTLEEVDEEEAKRVADLIEKHFGIVEDIGKMPERSKEFKEWTENHKETFECALKLRNNIRGRTTHASGYFISYFDLDGFVPLELTKEKELSLSFEMTNASKFGCKLDLLGLTQCEILKEFFEETKININLLDLDNDETVYNALQSDVLLPYGLYQISADCMLKVVKKIKPKNIHELSDCNAIARPGALDYLDEYVEGNHPCPHELFKNILMPSRNFCLYQEQMMQALVAVGFTLDEAEVCRKIVGKKLVKEVKEWEDKIHTKIKENNLPEELGSILWKILFDSAKYSFNKSHSLMVSYLGAITVKCKYSHPLQFYTACLNATRNLPNPFEEIAKIETELKSFNIKLLGPDIIKSDTKFKIENGNIRYSIGAIRGISDKTIEKLKDFRHDYSSKFEIMLGANEAGLNIGALSSICQSGCLDSYLSGTTRSRMVKEICTFNLLTPREKKKVVELAPQFNFDLFNTLKHIKTIKNEKGKPFFRETRLETIRGKLKKYNEIYDKNSKHERLANYFFELNNLGFVYSDTLPNILREYYPEIIDLNQIKNLIDNEKVVVCGAVNDFKYWKSREKKTDCCKVVVSDATSSVELLLFNDKISQNEVQNGGKFEKGWLIVANGWKKGDSIFCDKIVNQNIKIFTKLADLKNHTEKISEE